MAAGRHGRCNRVGNQGREAEGASEPPARVSQPAQCGRAVGRSGSGRAVGWLNTGPSHHQHGRRRRHYHCHRPRAAALRTRVTLLRPRCGWEDRDSAGGWRAVTYLSLCPKHSGRLFSLLFAFFRRPGSLGLGASYGRNKQGNFAAVMGWGGQGRPGGAEGYHDLDSCASGRDTRLVTQVDARTLVCAS